MKWKFNKLYYKRLLRDKNYKNEFRIVSVTVTEVSIGDSIYLESECRQRKDRQCIHLGTDKRVDDYNNCKLMLKHKFQRTDLHNVHLYKPSFEGIQSL